LGKVAVAGVLPWEAYGRTRRWVSFSLPRWRADRAAVRRGWRCRRREIPAVQGMDLHADAVRSTRAISSGCRSRF